ncbi:MAG: perosamine synthetase [Acidobacteriota bacterium]|jgi:dTDP-4-amino-4,6-dideoxygalactose transaminase|nr:perosamine synthetase [Acidobacteriota bacterium]
MISSPIHSQPRASLRLLTHSHSRAMTDALKLAPRLYHFSRDAIHELFGSLGYPNKTPVWMPSYHCGMEVRAAADAGFSPRFYRVKKDLTVDEEDLANGLRDAPGPVLLIHYFGFPQPGTLSIASLCRRFGVPLVEDCSHAFLSRLGECELGAFGQAATFSLYKTLGTLDGGALRVDEAALGRLTGQHFALPTQRPQPTIAWDAHRKRRQPWHGASMIGQNGKQTHETLAARFEERVVTARQRIFEGKWLYGRGISRLSHALIQRLDSAMVLERRRRNYLQLDSLLDGAAGYRPVLSELPLETCPLYLPVFVRHRAEILVRLQAAQVETFIFGMFNHPAMDTAQFPESRCLREEILCLPVHQNLDDQDMKRMASLLSPLLEADARNLF